MLVKVTISARLPVKLTKRKKWVVASCPILDVSSQGETIEKAKKNLGEALTLFFISCFEMGTLDSVFKKCGLSPMKSLTPQESKKVTPPQDYINVPIPFAVKQGGQAGCHA